MVSGVTREIATGDTVPLANGGTGATTADVARTNLGLPGLFGRRNMIGNGALLISQRGFSGTGFIADRFQTFQAGSYAAAFTRDTNAPPGFTISAKAAITSSAAVTAASNLTVYTAVEGLDLQRFGLGAAGAITIAASFWVRSSLVGTYAFSVRNAAANRSYVAPFTVNAANTWEYKTILIPGDTSGTWVTDTSVGMYVNINPVAGSTYQTPTPSAWVSGNYVGISTQTQLCTTNGATFQITGLQLERESVTSFEYRSFAEEMAWAQRYYEVGTGQLGGYNTAGSSTYYRAPFQVTKRVVPTMTYSTLTSINCSVADIRDPGGSTVLVYCTPAATGAFAFAANWTASAELI